MTQWWIDGNSSICTHAVSYFHTLPASTASSPSPIIVSELFHVCCRPFWRSIVAHDLAYPNQHDVHIQQIHRVVGIHQIVDRADCTMTMNSNSICLQKLRMLTRSGYFFISIFNDAPAACRPVSIIHTHIHDTTYTDQSEWKQNVSW